jgi:hypothetical protein
MVPSKYTQSCQELFRRIYCRSQVTSRNILDFFFCGLGTDLLEIRETAARYPWSSFARTACRGFADPPGPFKQSGSIKQIDIPMDMQPDMRMCMQLHLRLAWTWDRNARRPGSLAKI